ncbi:MAG: hypothetical protein G01um101438_456 [Parcubacteria group bacterium Gr01-1014_38]|nr:MAG: hypothetical protein G01um101438_456 [Parcubacteria group bacterium Gr01-1014_38]
MSETEVLENVRKILDVILELGVRQQAAYKSLHLKGSGLYVPKVIHEGWVLKKPKVHQHLLLEAFWDAYAEVAASIERPIVSFAIRPLLELSFGKAIFFGELKNEKEREEKALKYHLLGLAFSIPHSDDSSLRAQYKALLPFLSPQDRHVYEQIREKGFPPDEVSDRLYRLYPSVRSERVISMVKKYWLNIYGRPIDEEAIAGVFRIYSGFVHPYVYHLTSLEEQAKHKMHLFRSASLLFLLGISTVIFANTLTHNAVTAEEIANIRAEVQSLFPSLLQYTARGHRQRAAKSASSEHAE